MSSEALQFNREKTPSEVVILNLEKIRKDLMEDILGESVGGNAGTVDIEGETYRCAAINGYFDKTTGLIVEFGNPQYRNMQKALEADTEKKLMGFTFRTAGVKERTVIVDVFYERNGYTAQAKEKEFDPAVRGIMKRTIEEYNKLPIQ